MELTLYRTTSFSSNYHPNYRSPTSKSSSIHFGSHRYCSHVLCQLNIHDSLTGFESEKRLWIEKSLKEEHQVLLFTDVHRSGVQS